MLKYVKGDLIKDSKNYELIGHQCNCFWSFGAGIAPQIKLAFPEAYQKDLKTPYGSEEKLGTISYTEETNPIVVNMYGQFKYTRTEVDTNYDALKNCFKLVKEKFSGKKMAFPLIGAGLAGGDWNIIFEIIEDQLKEEDVTIIVWEKDLLNLKKFNVI
jgi:O-acetyl-ADP-ribose deacetylase (regulator of RNase III)